MSVDVAAPAAVPSDSPDAPATIRQYILHWLKMTPLIVVHLAVFAIPFVEFHWWSIPVMLFFAYLFGIAVAVGNHRYFSHRAFKTSRAFQFLIGFISSASMQNGPLWWASTHRKHHAHSDVAGDPHSPVLHGFWYAHIGWICGPRSSQSDYSLVKDFMRYPEIVWLDRFFFVPGLLLAWATYSWLGWSGVVWGNCLGAVWAVQVALAIGSIGHLYGPQAFDNGDGSRNNVVLGFLALGDGWHNNHHRAPSSAKQGFTPDQPDLGYDLLCGLRRLGIVWDLKLPPPSVLKELEAKQAVAP